MTVDPSTETATRDPWRADWRGAFPRGVLDPNGPAGEPISTPTDRRLLWHIQTMLAVSATNDTLRDLGRALNAYLGETCEHHWRDSEGDDAIPAHRQCLWCCRVEFAGDRDV